MSDAITTPPTFDEMVALIEQNFKCYVQSTKAFTEAEIEEGWQRYKTLNHLYRDELPHIHKESVEENWESFWKSIVTNEDGTINIEQIKKELHDFSFIMEQVPKVYCHITGNRMSKVMYHADTVISVADDYFQEQLDEAVKDEKGEQLGVVWVKTTTRMPEIIKPTKLLTVKRYEGVPEVYSVRAMTAAQLADIVKYDLANFEWLDESGTAAAVTPTFWDVAKAFKWAAEYRDEIGGQLTLYNDQWTLISEDEDGNENETKDLTPGNVAELYCLQNGFNKENEGTAAGREEDAVAFAEWAGWDWRRVEGKSLWENQKTLEVMKTAQLYKLFKQQKEK